MPDAKKPGATRASASSSVPPKAKPEPAPKSLDDEAPVEKPADDSAAPPEIHPQSTEAEHHLRVGFENQINAGAEEFAARARHAYIDAKLAGKEITLTVE